MSYARRDVASVRLAGTPRAALRWPELLRRFPELIPALPAPPVARVPPPPQLSPHGDRVRHAYELARAYHVVCSRRWPYAKALKGSTEKNVAQAPQFTTLLKAVPKMREYEVAPMSWCAFSVDVHLEYARGRRRDAPPPVSWVYELARLEHRNDWYAFDMSRWTGGRVIVGEAHKELYRLWWALRVELLHHAALDDAAVGAIVREHLPPTVMRRLVKLAEADARYVQADLDDRVRRGDFVWD